MRHCRPPWLAGPVDRLLVFRALQVGDMLCAVPALRALRRAFPDAYITLVGLRWAGQFAQRFAAYLDEFIPFPGHPSLPEQPADAAAYANFIHRLRAHEFDLALQLHGSGELSNPVVREFSARVCTGFTRDPVRDGPGFIPYPAYGHESLRLLRLAAALGGDASDARPEFPLLPQDQAELDASGLPQRLAGKPYVCLHAGARDPARRWRPACFAALGDALSRQGMTIVLTGAEAEHALAGGIAARMRAPAVNAALPISLGAMALLMQRARGVVCNDTGASHIAAGLGVPSVVVFTREDPAHLERWAPLDWRRHVCVVDSAGSAVTEVLGAATRVIADQARGSGPDRYTS